MSDDFDELERIARGQHADHTNGDRRDISVKSRVHQRRMAEKGGATKWIRWRMRTVAPITLPKIKAFDE